MKELRGASQQVLKHLPSEVQELNSVKDSLVQSSTGLKGAVKARLDSLRQSGALQDGEMNQILTQISKALSTGSTAASIAAVGPVPVRNGLRDFNVDPEIQRFQSILINPESSLSDRQMVR